MESRAEIIERSFALVAPRGDELVERMYAITFSRHPDLLALFAGVDMGELRGKFLDTLHFVCKAMGDFESFAPVLQLLGEQHRHYGIAAMHYPVLGAALLGAMAEVGGADWQPEYTAAWAEAYDLVQEAMQREPVPLW